MADSLTEFFCRKEAELKHKSPRFETNLPNIVIAFLLILLFSILSNQSTALAAQPQVAAGGKHTVGLKSDGTAVAVGDNEFGQINVSSWTDIVQVAAGSSDSLGLKSDGTVVAAGFDFWGLSNVGSWTDIVQVADGNAHTVGLKSDGIEPLFLIFSAQYQFYS
jgi:hypothetical protein